MAIDVQKLWGLPEAPNTITIAVRHTCGHIERYPFEGIAEANGYRMSQVEAERHAALRSEPCLFC